MAVQVGEKPLQWLRLAEVKVLAVRDAELAQQRDGGGVAEDVGHFPMIEAPDRFNAVLAATLASFGS